MCRHQDASSDEGISSRIEEFDRGQVGVAQPAKAGSKALATGRQAKGQSADAAVSPEEAAQSQDAAAAGTHVQVCPSTCNPCQISFLHIINVDMCSQ